MNRNTARDKAFAKAFGSKLASVFEWNVKDRRNPKRISVEEFASSLNLTRAGLHKAKSGKSVPSLDLIERARVYGVNVGYGDLSVPFVRQKARTATLPEAQLYLPFAISGLTEDDIQVEIGKRRPDAVQVKVWIKFGTVNGR